MTIYDKLKQEFLRNHPEITYFQQAEIFRYFDMAFCIGYDEHDKRFKGRSIKIMRSDGVEFESIAEAARKVKCNYDNLCKALKKNHKYGGYYWKLIKTK
jgi:hypothetical protein